MPTAAFLYLVTPSSPVEKPSWSYFISGMSKSGIIFSPSYISSTRRIPSGIILDGSAGGSSPSEPPVTNAIITVSTTTKSATPAHISESFFIFSLSKSCLPFPWQKLICRIF